jgi:hypothetical protein
MSASRRDPHLGELAAALVDGALDHAARDRALSHLTLCDDCRAEVDAQRRMKAQLAAMDGPGLPPGLAARLSSLPDRSPASTPADLPPDRFGARFRTGARPPARGRTLGGAPLTIAGAAELSPIPLASEHPVLAGAVRLPAAPSASMRRAGPDRPAGQPGASAGSGPAGRGGPIRSRRTRRRIAATAAGGLAAFALTLAAVAAAGSADDLKPVSPPVGTFTVEHSKTGGAPGPNPEVGAADAAVTRR